MENLLSGSEIEYVTVSSAPLVLELKITEPVEMVSFCELAAKLPEYTNSATLPTLIVRTFVVVLVPSLAFKLIE